MPIIRIEIIAGKSAEYKKAVLDGVHNALMEAFRIPDTDRIQIITEHLPEDFERKSEHSDRFTLIEISAFAGRSIDAKRRLYTAIVNNLKTNPGIESSDVFILVNEQPLDNWGVRGGKPASEIDFGFKIDV